jgi:hypothetical protein
MDFCAKKSADTILTVLYHARNYRVNSEESLFHDMKDRPDFLERLEML